METISIR